MEHTPYHVAFSSKRQVSSLCHSLVLSGSFFIKTESLPLCPVCGKGPDCHVQFRTGTGGNVAINSGTDSRASFQLVSLLSINSSCRYLHEDPNSFIINLNLLPQSTAQERVSLTYKSRSLSRANVCAFYSTACTAAAITVGVQLS